VDSLKNVDDDGDLDLVVRIFKSEFSLIGDEITATLVEKCLMVRGYKDLIPSRLYRGRTTKRVKGDYRQPMPVRRRAGSVISAGDWRV